MKIKLQNGLYILAFISIFLFSCEPEESVQPDDNDGVVDNTTELLLLQEGINDLTGVNGVYQNFENLGLSRLSTLGRSKAKTSKRGRTQDDETCALVTIKENADGSYSLILDFGEEGCVDDGQLIKGIVTFTGSETDSSGTLKVEFDNFSEEPADGSEDDEPFTINGYYQGEFAWNPDAEFDYVESYDLDLRLDYKDGTVESVEASGEARGNEQKYVVLSHVISGENNTGDEFYAEVVKPLVYDLTCESLEIYTEGTQNFRFNEDTATVDFGEGTCDNIVTITAPGITIIIDLDEIEGA